MKKEKSFEAVLTIVLGLVVLFFIYKKNWFLYSALIIGIPSVLFRVIADKIAWIWGKLSEGLGFISSKILLSVIFYFFLLPIALFSRLFGKKYLQLKKEDGNSYFFTRNKKYTAEDFKNPW